MACKQRKSKETLSLLLEGSEPRVFASLCHSDKERRPIAIGMDQMGGCRTECERWAGRPSKRG